MMYVQIYNIHNIALTSPAAKLASVRVCANTWEGAGLTLKPAPDLT